MFDRAPTRCCVVNLHCSRVNIGRLHVAFCSDVKSTLVRAVSALFSVRLTLVSAMALTSCRVLRTPPYLSCVRRLQGSARDGAPAASEDLSSRKQWNELEMIFSYDGWGRDADQAEEEHARYGQASAILDSMRRKQQLHSGDRSHPFIRKLDALTPTLSYDGWEEDARMIECAGGNGVFEGLGMDEKGVDRLLARMRRKQAECDGDRSHKDLRELDELKTAPGS